MITKPYQNNDERAEQLKTLIRHSTEARLKMPTVWFDDTPCSEKMSKQKKEIKEAIDYFKKDGKVNITIEEGEEYFIVTMEAT